jgi:hypothetical protein
MNLGLWRVWKYMPQVQLLAQTYDSITFQFRETADANAIISEALRHIRVELTEPGGRSYIVPGEAKIGWNWGACVSRDDVAEATKANPGKRPPRLNPDGLVKWRPAKPDERRRQTGLDRIMV